VQGRASAVSSGTAEALCRAQGRNYQSRRGMSDHRCMATIDKQTTYECSECTDAKITLSAGHDLGQLNAWFEAHRRDVHDGDPQVFWTADRDFIREG
jgi:hypothetical protein